MNAETLFENFATFAEAPNGVTKLRELILQLAIQGKLVPQDKNDEPASVLADRIEAERGRRIKAGELRDSADELRVDETILPFSLPPTWKWVRLGRIMQKMGAGSTPLGGKKVYVDDGIKFLRSQNVWDDGLVLDDVARIAPEVHQTMSGTWVDPGDVLLNITGASIGRSALVPDDFGDANVSQHVAILRLIDLDIRHFLHLCVISPFFQATIMRVQVGVSREGLSMTRLREFPFPLPPLAEQRRIVEKVDQLLGLCDELAARQAAKHEVRSALVGATLDRVVSVRTAAEFPAQAKRLSNNFDLLFDTPTTIPQLRRAILQLAVQGQLVPQDPNDEPADSLLCKVLEARVRLGLKDGKSTQTKTIADGIPYELPSSWNWVRLQELCSFENGDRSKNYPSGTEIKTVGIPFVSTKSIANHRVSPDGIDFITPEKFASLRSGKLKDRDIVVVLRGSVGKFGMFLATDEFVTGFINAQLVIVRNHLPEIAAYALEYFKSPVFQQLALARATGSAQPQLSAFELSLTLFPLPPLAEQKRIVSKVTELLSLCDALEAKLTQAESASTQLLSAAVHHLLDGSKANA